MNHAVQRRPNGGITHSLMWAHDSLTRALFGVSMIAAAYLTLVLAWEVIARYWLHMPSSWAPDTAGISFALVAFLAAPMLAWKNGHANMNMVVKALPPGGSKWLERFTMLLACAVCLLAAWFGWIELLRLYKRGVMMIAVTPIPKWWLMTAIVYALGSSGLYYLRHFLCSFCRTATPGTHDEVA
ncbi:TRAP transporter small permease [Paenalcaligenes niemegkensis]|uniref:TRAP transporter small permease n=1 Tax=Paenalcaligenes niemegkensis TaxID=2895469 RepID=UPI001EE8441C|nr:TRAP transporter small permease [Paenalcaligenes niemegkensis]MCQ9618133.1 TRAP transporter small permease [Paenalcaligenes niemegkensis]